MADGAAPITIKKYANRRLYDTDSSSYVTLADLARKVRDGVDFVVVDARNGDDITRAVLTQIVIEEEAKGAQLLPINFLRKLIGLHGDDAHALLPHFLDQSMDAFASHGERLRRLVGDAADTARPLATLQGIVRENLEVFERSAVGQGRDSAPSEPTTSTFPPGTAEPFDTLQRELAELQRKFETLRRKFGG